MSRTLLTSVLCPNRWRLPYEFVDLSPIPVTQLIPMLLSIFRNSAILLGCVLINLFVCSDNSNAQEVGDRVVVTASFDTLITNKKVDKVFEGNVHTITGSEGKWRMLSDVKGWILVENLMNLDMALKHFTKRISENDTDYIAYAHRGMIYHEKEEYARAFADLNQSLTINPKNPVTWMHRGMVLKAQGKFVLAAKDIKKSIELNPKLANAHFNIGLVFYSMNDHKQAIKAYNAAIKLDDSHSLWFVSRGSARLAIDDVAGAREDYEHAIELNDSLADAHVGLSNLALVEEDLDAAYKHANNAVEIQSSNAMGLNARGWVLYKQGKIDDAILDLSRAIRRAPRLSIAYGNRGVCYVSRNEFDKAIADHTRHHKLDPTSPFALSNRGVAWLGKGEFDKAKDDFEAAEKLAPELDETLNGFAWFLSTCPDAAFRDGKLAIEKATAACKASDYKDWYQLDTLAAAYAETGEFGEAIKWAKKALEVAPSEKKDICKEQLTRFEAKKPFRSQIGKNAEQGMRGS